LAFVVLTFVTVCLIIIFTVVQCYLFIAISCCVQKLNAEFSKHKLQTKAKLASLNQQLEEAQKSAADVVERVSFIVTLSVICMQFICLGTTKPAIEIVF